ncbi:MAG TPA: hypothetical protein VGL63_10340 [Streptosporangiaceae bacterium]
MLALIAGSVVLATRHTPSGTGRSRQAGQKLTPAAAAGTLAAAWVAGQVSRSVTVSCDPAMCAALQQRGFPAGNLVIAGRGALDPRDSSLIVVTAALRNELGRRLDSEYAPVVLAVLGAGNDKIEIRASAPDGPAAYQSQFNADFAARKSVGTELLLNPNVEADQPARQQLSEGRVDSRLIGMIGIMAMMHPVHLVSFGDASPGASPEVPLRSALLYGVAHGATAGTAVLGSLRTLLLAQRPSYRPAGVRIVRLTAGRNALRIEFTAPDPLGLLDASQPLVKISSP